VCEAFGMVDGIVTAKSNIAIAKSKYESGNIEELMKTSQELYEMRVSRQGEGNEYTILSGNTYALELTKESRWRESRELLMKLLATSKQVLGAHHSTTKETESKLKWVVVQLINRNNEELLKASHELHELCVAQIGEGHVLTLHLGAKYAIELRKANCGDEAKKLLIKLLATSKQVLGPHTKEVTSGLEWVVAQREISNFDS